VPDREQYEERLGELFQKGMRGTMARVFAEYVARFSEPDRKFDESYLAGLFASGTPPKPLRRRDRFRRLLKEFERALPLEGCVAECGCASGLSSFLLCSRLKQHDRAFDGAGYEIYDSFQGLSEPQAEDALEPGADELVAQTAVAGRFAFPVERVQRTLSAFPKVTYGPGWIPQAFPKDDRRYRFAHVDVDLYQPTLASFEYFWPRLVPGGVMVCDDYNWGGAKRAVEEFSAAVGALFTVTPNTQAVFTKP
jgi:hypothetical protein